MCTISLDMENTMFISGKLEEDCSSDIISWILTSYNDQKEELAAVKKIAKKSKKKAIERGEKVEDKPSTLKRPLITLIINSPGGNYDDLTAIYDIIQLLDADIRTIAIGGAMSAGALLTISGTKGMRYMTPTSRLMFHAVSMGIEGKAQDIKIDYKESQRLNQQAQKIILNHTNISNQEEVEMYTDRDIYILPEEALKLGMIDGIIDSFN